MDVEYLRTLAVSIAQIKRMLMDIKSHLGIDKCDCLKTDVDSFGYCIHGNMKGD